jgi:hypothetical protein
MVACRDELVKVRRPLGGDIGPGDADAVETQRAGLFGEPVLQIVRRRR